MLLHFFLVLHKLGGKKEQSKCIIPYFLAYTIAASIVPYAVFVKYIKC